jgi:hypothetical protein
MLKGTTKAADIARAEEAIAKAAESYPDVVEEGPWGHRAFKIRGKTFLFLGADGDGLSFSVKLPLSGKEALRLGFTEPTHYGLGKAGWVTARFAPKDKIPLATVREWLDESFRAIAPKKVALALGASTGAAPSKRTKAKASPRSSPAVKTSDDRAPKARHATAKAATTRRPKK